MRRDFEVRRSDTTGAGRRSPVALGFVLGGGLVSAAVTTERVLHHHYVYRSNADALLHLSISLLVGMGIGLVWGVPCALFNMQLGPPARRTRVLAWTGAAVGLAAGAVLYLMVVRPSKYGAMFNPAVGSLVLGVAGAAVGATATFVASVAIRRAPTAAALALLAFVASIAWMDMHMYLRSYGNVHVVAAIAIWSLAGLACAVLLARAHVTARLSQGLAGLALICGVHAALAKDTMSARVAVLDFGGGEKLVIKHLLWPLFDRDGDGQAKRFWGSDCDDTNATISAGMPPYYVRAFGCKTVAPRPPAQPVAVSDAGGQPTRSFVWVLIDTWRADTPKSMPAAFEPFVNFAGYRACGSRTQEVINHLLGQRNCMTGGIDAGIPAALESAGYSVKAFAQPNVVSQLFVHSELYPTADGLVQNAESWIHEQERLGKPYFAYLHFQGGHEPYEGAGRTARERYDAAIAKAVERAAALVEAIGPKPVFLVMGDHGEEFNEHEGRAHASSLYEEVLATRVYLRVPGWPGRIEAGGMGCGDLRRTIWSALAGSPYHFEPSDGMFATLDSPPGVHGGISRTLIHAMRFDGKWKIIWRPNVDIWELYDLANDRGERSNLADEQPDQLRMGASRLIGTLEACDKRATPPSH